MAEPVMRVLHVVASRRRRGAEMFAADLVDQLAATDISQRVVALRDGDDEVLAFNGLATVLHAKHSMLRVDAAAILRLRRSIKSWNPSVVQAHGGESFKYALAAAWGTDRVVVYRRIGATPVGSAHSLQIAGHRRLMKRAKAVIAVSEANRREVVETFGVDADRIVVIPNGVDIRRAEPTRPRRDVRRELGIDDDTELITSVGALHPEKDPLGQLDVFEHVTRVRPGTQFVMVGSGILEDETKRSVSARGLTDRVRMLGTRSDVPDLLGAADVLLLASRSEGMPAVAIEAGITATPVAGYALSGVPEVVVDGTTGLLAQPGDAEELATAVIRLLGDKDFRVRLGIAARERCITRFGIGNVASRYADLYRQLTGDAALIGVR